MASPVPQGMKLGKEQLKVVSSVEHVGTLASAFTNVYYYVPTDPSLGKEVGPLAFRHLLCAGGTGNTHKGINYHTGLPFLRYVEKGQHQCGPGGGAEHG